MLELEIASRARPCLQTSYTQWGQRSYTQWGQPTSSAYAARVRVCKRPTLNGDSVATLNGDRKLNRWIEEEEEGREPILNAK